MALGLFDPELVSAAWFDSLLIPAAWFDEDLADPSEPPPAGLNVTLAPATSSAAGSVAIVGGASATLAAATVSAAGVGPVTFGIGVSAASQELYSVWHGGSYTETTKGTDSTVSSVNASTDTLTASTAHDMISGDGPYRFTSTGTLPAGLALDTDYWVYVTSSTAYKVATSPQNAIAGTAVNITDSGTGTHTLVRTVDTAASGSLILAFQAKGDWAGAPSSAPTDNKGNSYTLLGSVHSYASFPGSSTAVHYKLNAAGGADHTWSSTGADYDEITIAALEVTGAGASAVIVSHSHVERAIGSATITSNTVTTTGPAWLVAVCFGNGPVSQDHTFTPPSGWDLQLGATRPADMSPSGYIQISVATRYYADPGTYSITWTGTANEGGQLYLIAVQQDVGRVGSGTATLAAAVVTATATATTRGAATITLDNATASASGSVPVVGASSATLEGAALSATGTLASNSTGALSATLGAATATAAGAVTIVGAAGGSLGAASSSAAGSVAVVGAIAATLGTASVTAAGKVAVSGAAALALSAASVGASGVAAVRGAAAITFAACVGSGAGAVGVSGALAASLAAAAVSASGTVRSGSSGVVEAILGDAGFAGVGAVVVAGVCGSVCADAVATGSGAVLVVGAAAATLGAATLAATAVVYARAGSEPYTVDLAETGAAVEVLELEASVVVDVGLGTVTVALSECTATVTEVVQAVAVTDASTTVSPMSYSITRGDALPELTATVKAAGVAQNLSGVQSVTLQGRSPTGVTWTKDMTVVSATAGTVKAAWTTAETAALEIGSHRCFIRVVFGDGRPLSFPSGDTGFEVVISRGGGS